jgi:hypothetical protein
MAAILTPLRNAKKVENLTDYLHACSEWKAKQKDATKVKDGFLSQLWYRGVNRHFERQVPGVYRPAFTGRAQAAPGNKNDEDKRLQLEREMISQFRTAGAGFLKGYTAVDIYFAAQHFGMPTRLLDWSTNPLAALFFACDGAEGQDGVVHMMDARKTVPANARKTDNEPLYQAIMTMRHPFVEYAVGISYWKPPKNDHHPHILPIRPDVVPGRIVQQSSCFTLHMHQALDVQNKTLLTIVIDKSKKSDIIEELDALNVNQFTIYHDLDHLSKELRRSWGVN